MTKSYAKKVNDLNVYYPDNLMVCFNISGHLMEPH